jgi:hypothetical protein
MRDNHRSPHGRGGPAPPTPPSGMPAASAGHVPAAMPAARGGKAARPRTRTPRMVVGSLVAAVILAVIVAVALTARAAAAGSDRPAATSAVVRIPAPKTPSVGVRLAILPWGSGPGAVGLARPLGGLARGPEALAVSPDGRIAILDSVNRRVVTLDSSGAFLAALPIEISAPRFIAADDATIHVLDADEDRRLVSLDWRGTVLEQRNLEARDTPVTGLFAREGQAYVEWGHSRVAAVRPGERNFSAVQPGRPLGPQGGAYAHARHTRGGHPRISVVRDPRRPTGVPDELEFASDVPLEHLVSLDADAEGAVILGARTERSDPLQANAPALVLVRVADPERPTTLALDDGGGIAETGQPYTVGPDGRVYQPRATDEGYVVLVHTFPQGESL